MKITSLYILAFLSMFTVLSACDEQEPAPFQSINGVYFNNRSSANALLEQIDVTFVYENDDLLEIPVKIQLLGRPVDFARPVDLRVTSKDAQEGIDYVLPAIAEIPAGASSVDYMVQLKRTDALKKQKKSLTLDLYANDYFTLPVNQEVQAGGQSLSYLRYQIYFSDMFTSAPTAWAVDLLGEFSQQKFELICDVLTIQPADFNDSSVMTLAMQVYIHSEMTAYVKEQVNKKEAGEPFNEKAFDEVGNPLTF